MSDGTTSINGQPSIQEVDDPIYAAAQANSVQQYNLIMGNANVFIDNCRNHLGAVLNQYLAGFQVSIDKMQKELALYHTIDYLVANQELTPERLQRILSDLGDFRAELNAEAEKMKAQMQQKSAVPTADKIN